MNLKSLIDFNTNPQPMDAKVSEGFIMLTMMEMKDPNFIDVIDKSSPVGLLILDKRLQWAGIADKVSFAVKLFIATISDRPGKVVMWAFTLVHMLELGKNLSNGRVTMNTLANQFPMGFPGDDAEHECWRAQKGEAHGAKCDNLMDVREEWEIT